MLKLKIFCTWYCKITKGSRIYATVMVKSVMEKILLAVKGLGEIIKNFVSYRNANVKFHEHNSDNWN